MNRPFLRDMAIATLLFIVAAIVGGGYYVWRGKDRFDQYSVTFAPALMMALGHGYTNPETLGNPFIQKDPVLQRFLRGQAPRLDVGALPAEIPRQSLHSYHRQWLYLIGTVGLTWRTFGISWNALGPLIGLFYGLTCVLTFAVSRLLLNRLLAAGVAVLIMLSPLNLHFLPILRDYSKAPFILFAIWVLGYVIKTPMGWKSFLCWAAALGLSSGIGIGFRQDVMICVPIAALVFLLFPQGSLLRELPKRLGAVSVLILCYIVAGWPILAKQRASRNASFHVITMGLMEPCNRLLGVGGAPYAHGYVVNDRFAYHTISRYGQRVLGDPEPVPFDSHDYDTKGFRFYLDTLKVFPADFLLRWYAAGRRVVDCAAFVPTWDDEVAPQIRDPLLNRALGQRAYCLKWLFGAGPFLVGLLLLSLLKASPRYALAVACVLLYFSGYVALQFDVRHYFHLEFLPLVLAGFGAQQIIGMVRYVKNSENRAKIWGWFKRPSVRMGRKAWSGVAVGVSLLVIPCGALAVARAYQRHQVAALFASYATAELAPLDVRNLPGTEPDWLLLGFPALETVSDGKPSEQDHAFYLAADLEGNRPLDVRLRYDYTDDFANFSSSARLRGDDGAPTRRRYFFPIYTEQGCTFRGLEIRSADVERLKGVYLVRNADAFPFHLFLDWSETWERLPTHLSLLPSRDCIPVWKRDMEKTP